MGFSSYGHFIFSIFSLLDKVYHRFTIFVFLKNMKMYSAVKLQHEHHLFDNQIWEYKYISADP